MKQSIKLLLGGALLLSLPMFLTSCQDILGEWDKPAPSIVTPSDGGGTTATNTYIKYTAPGTSTNEPIGDATKWNITSGDVAAGTYYVEGDVTCTGALTLQGEVNLILKDGATLTVNEGTMPFFDGANYVGDLNIFAQSTDPATMGKLIVTKTTPVGASPSEAPALVASNLTIHGGKIDATGGATADATQYGLEVLGGKLTIYGGVVNALGKGTSYGICVDGLSSSFEIYGGDVTITGGGANAFYSNAFTLGTGLKYYAADTANPESNPAANELTAPFANTCPNMYAKIQKSE